MAAPQIVLINNKECQKDKNNFSIKKPGKIGREGVGKGGLSGFPFSSNPPLHPNGWGVTTDIGLILQKSNMTLYVFKDFNRDPSMHVYMDNTSNEDIKVHFS